MFVLAVGMVSDMSVYVISDDNLEYYLELINNPDSRAKIVGMQNLLFELEKGKLLTAYGKQRIENALFDVISFSPNARVRQWCYMVGAFLISRILTELCKNRFEMETAKNQSWILALLSHNLSPIKFAKMRKIAENYLSEDVIDLSIYLFSQYSRLTPDQEYVNKIIQAHEDKLAILWLGWIATFYHLDMRVHHTPLIHDYQMAELSGSHDDDVLKHIMAAYSKRDSFRVGNIRFSVYEYLNMATEHKKWTMAAIFKDTAFTSGNKDYLLELISSYHLFQICDKREREGLASGLSNYCFDPDLVQGVLEWYSNESETSVKQYLLQYLLKWQSVCDDYKEMVKSDAGHGSSTDKRLIHLHQHDIVDPKDKQEVTVIVKTEKFFQNIYALDRLFLQEVDMNNTNPTIINGNNNTVNNQNISSYGDNSPIIINNNTVSEEIRQLLSEIEQAIEVIQQSNELDSDQKEILLDILEEVKQSKTDDSEESKEKEKRSKEKFKNIKPFLLKTAPALISVLASLSQIAMFFGLHL